MKNKGFAGWYLIGISTILFWTCKPTVYEPSIDKCLLTKVDLVEFQNTRRGKRGLGRKPLGVIAPGVDRVLKTADHGKPQRSDA